MARSALGLLSIAACAAPEERAPSYVAPAVDAAPALDTASLPHDAGDASVVDEPGQTLERALAQADRVCERDSDCTLLEINTPCRSGCDLVGLSRAVGYPRVSSALAAVSQSCTVDAGSRPWYSSFYCSSRGFRAHCRDARCEAVVDPCSPGCEQQGDSCAGAPSAACQRCPSLEALDAFNERPCAVLGQRCHYGACVGTAECIVDDARVAQAWSFVFVDCI